jgi:hypothetical protein
MTFEEVSHFIYILKHVFRVTIVLHDPTTVSGVIVTPPLSLPLTSFLSVLIEVHQSY